MTARKYTPGPWVWSQDEASGAPVRSLGNRTSLICAFEAWPPNAADAALIGAAPELYQACVIAEDVLAYLEDEIGEGHLEVRDALHAVAAAIDKARGES